MKTRSTSAILGLTTLYLSAVAYAAEDAPPTVRVGAFAQHAGGKIVYQYRVSNNTSQTVSAIAIGRDSRGDGNPANDTYELTALPSGWNPKFGIPASNYNAPTGWRANTVAPEEGATVFAISWEPLNDRTPKLLPKQSTSRFSVTLDQPDDAYLDGHATASFADGYQPMSNVLERVDTSPPVLTVTLSPNTLLSQEESKPAAIKASFTVRDDYDSMPQIRLESITANAPVTAEDILDASLGRDDRYFKIRSANQSDTERIYTVTYSATDGSGNQTLASATVTVMPRHEEGAPAAAPE